MLDKSKFEKSPKRIMLEIKVLKRLRHPNIVQLFEVIETTDFIYLVMEYVTGGELFKRIV